MRAPDSSSFGGGNRFLPVRLVVCYRWVGEVVGSESPGPLQCIEFHNVHSTPDRFLLLNQFILRPVTLLGEHADLNHLSYLDCSISA